MRKFVFVQYGRDPYRLRQLLSASHSALNSELAELWILHMYVYVLFQVSS